MWKDKYIKEAINDLDNLDNELREIVLAGIKKSKTKSSSSIRRWLWQTSRK